MLKKFVLLIVCLLLLSSIAQAQDSNLVGPIIIGSPIGGEYIGFHDIGSGAKWQVAIDGYEFIREWSPDGCYLMTYNNLYETYNLIKVARRTVMQQIIGDSAFRTESPNEYTQPHFSPDSNRLAYTVRPYIYDDDKSNDDDPSIIQIMGVSDLKVEATYEVEPRAFVSRWISENEIEYVADDKDNNQMFFALNLNTGQSQLITTEPPRWTTKKPMDWRGKLFVISPSPDKTFYVQYYSHILLINATDPRFTSLENEEIEALEKIPRIPGFEIHKDDTGQSWKEDFFGEYVNNLSWSPDSKKLAISTYTPPSGKITNKNGIYIYDIQSKIFRRLGKDISVRTGDPGEYGVYELIWSPYNAWLAFNTLDGWAAYRLEDDYEVPLSEDFNGFTMTLNWSPVMDYSDSHCR